MASLVTIGVEGRRGRVSYIGREGEKEYVTVECPEEKEAWRFIWTRTGVGSPIVVGEWLVFSGETRVEILRRKIVEKPYYHNPHTREIRHGWVYYDVCTFTEPTRRTGSIETDNKIDVALNRLQAHFSDWPSNAYQKKLDETADCLEIAAKALREEAKIVASEPASVVEVNI